MAAKSDEVGRRCQGELVARTLGMEVGAKSLLLVESWWADDSRGVESGVSIVQGWRSE
jgi:hypothetical protein